jgi:HAD superfamily hydrolase (TIGR01450 family)
MHDVVRISEPEPLAILVALNVVRGRTQISKAIVGGVAKGGKRFETRHNDSVPSRQTILCDVDGVIWLMRQPLPGAVEAFRELIDAGHEVLFVTNNSFSTVAAQEGAFSDIGIDASGRLVTSSMAAAFLLDSGSVVAVNGGPGIVEAVESAGASVILVETLTDGDFATRGITDVVVGFDRDFDYERLHVLSALVRDGARLIGTNEDATYPTNRGVIPGGGAILSAVATAAGARPVVAGKPHEAMAALVAQRIGPTSVDTTWMVGDRLSTDGLFAHRLGCRFAHVKSAVTETDVDVRPSVVVGSFGEFVEQLLGDALS